MNTTRRGLAALTTAALAAAAVAAPAAAKPLPTIWHELHRRARIVHERWPFLTGRRRELGHQLELVTGILADLTAALEDERTADVPR